MMIKNYYVLNLFSCELSKTDPQPHFGTSPNNPSTPPPSIFTLHGVFLAVIFETT